jgi:hypothetical protein
LAKDLVLAMGKGLVPDLARAKELVMAKVTAMETERVME